MLICEHAHNLFDAYLDDELSSSMRMELNAHRLSCVSCQQQLTLLESCADVVSRDETAPALSDAFTDRVMAALPAMTVTAPRTARIYRLFVPVGAVAAAIAMVIMLTPPISSTKEATNNRTNDTTQVASSEQHKTEVASAVVVASENKNGGTTLITLANEPDQAGPVMQTSEYNTPLPKAMVDGGLTPTVQGWQQLRSDGTTFRELGKIMLERAVSNVAGQQAVPAVGSATEPIDEDAETGEVGDLLKTNEDQPL